MVFVYSQDVSGSLENIDRWVVFVRNESRVDENASFFLVENRTSSKVHLYTKEQGREKAGKYSMEFHYVNADTGENVEELLASIANIACCIQKNRQSCIHRQLDFK